MTSILQIAFGMGIDKADGQLHLFSLISPFLPNSYSPFCYTLFITKVTGWARDLLFGMKIYLMDDRLQVLPRNRSCRP